MSLHRVCHAPRTRTSLSLALAALALSACSVAPGEPRRSLNDSRLDIIKGSAPGITVIPAPAAASAPGAAAPVAQGAGGRPASPGWIAPPTGRPLRDATQLDSPSDGITLPTAPTPPAARKPPTSGG